MMLDADLVVVTGLLLIEVSYKIYVKKIEKKIKIYSLENNKKLKSNIKQLHISALRK